MFGHTGFGQNSFSAINDELRSWLNANTSLTASFSYVLYTANQTFATKPTDTLANQPFRGTLSSYNFKRSIAGSGTFGGIQTGDGQLVIDNGDAFYDFLPEQYSISGRQISLKVGRSTDSYDDYFPINKITASDWDVDETNVTINLRDYGYKLDVPIQINLYGGTGGADGGTDLTGKRIPLSYGVVLNVPPPLIVPSLLIYQVNDGTVQDINAVYDRGVLLTQGTDYATYALLAAASPSAGTYATSKAKGLFKLGSTPAGTVTADVQGDNSGAGYVVKSADICRRILGTKTTLVDSTDFNTTSFTAVNTLQAATIGYYIGENDTLTVADVCTNIMNGVGGWLGFTRQGLVYVNIFTAPTGTPLDSFDRTDVYGQAKREPLPSTFAPAIWRWRVIYQRVWQTQTDLASSIGATRRAYVSNPFRLANASNTAVQTDYPFAKDPAPIEAYFANLADAQTEATRLLTLYQTTRHLYRVTLPRRVLLRELGDVIRLTYPRWDLSAGKIMTICEVSESVSAAGDNVEVLCYG